MGIVKRRTISGVQTGDEVIPFVTAFDLLESGDDPTPEEVSAIAVAIVNEQPQEKVQTPSIWGIQARMEATEQYRTEAHAFTKKEFEE